MEKYNSKIIFKDFFVEGEKKETDFLNLLIKYKGGEAYCSTTNENIYKHIDVFWKWKPNKIVSFDVKGLKKINRNDKLINENIEWIELKNVSGNKGWLYGDEDYVAFEQINEWIIIERKKLIDIVEKNILSKDILNEKKMFHLYQRKGRKDVITLFPTSLIKENANIILNK